MFRCLGSLEIFFSFEVELELSLLVVAASASPRMATPSRQIAGVASVKILALSFLGVCGSKALQVIQVSLHFCFEDFSQEQGRCLHEYVLFLCQRVDFFV